MQRLLTLTNVSWLVLYAAMLIAITWALFTARSWAVDSLTDAATTASWEEFRRDSADPYSSGPVERRVPPSTEPPTLRLLRDHFPASLAAALFFFSAVFFSLMILLRGVFSGGSTNQQHRFADVEPPQ